MPSTYKGWVRGTALRILNFGARWGWVVSVTPRLLYPREWDPLPIVQEARWVSGPVCAES